MIIIGLTGSVGTGKTETAKFSKEKVPVFDSDNEVRLLYKKGMVIRKIREEFPKVFTNNILIKEKLAEIVFKDTNISVLESILYKYLKIKRYLWIRKSLEKKRKWLFWCPITIWKRQCKSMTNNISKLFRKNSKAKSLKRKGWDNNRLS